MNDEKYLKTLTVVIRVVGVFTLLISPLFLLGALINPSSQGPSIVAGILLIVIGVGCLRGKAITSEQVKWFRKK